MIRPARVVSCALLGLFGALIAQACSSSSPKQMSGGSGAVMGDAGPDLGDGSQELQPNGEGGAAGASPYNPLCGVNSVSDCVPDDESACENYVPPGGAGGAPTDGPAGGHAGTGAGQTGTEGGGAGASGRAGGEGGSAGDVGSGGATDGPASAGGATSAGEGGQGGQSGQAGQSGRSGQGGAADGPSSVGAGGADAGDAGQAGSPESNAGRAGEAGGPVTAEGGASGQPSIAGSGGMSGGGGAPGTGPMSEYACRAVPSPGGGIQSQCEPAGQGGVDAPCFTSADCAPGLACTGDSGAGQCRRFCCAGDGECRRGTHCAERSLLGAVARPVVPVCVPAVDCSLTEPFPCPDGVKCSCPEGEACMVVRNDGTTTCMRPGAGTAGDACPCASGHICSQATHQCVRLCQTAATPSECGSGRCQASAELPAGFGVCVGLTQPEAN